MKNFVDQYEVNYKYIKQTIKVNTMIKTIKVTSLIGLILEGFLSLMFALFSQRQFPVCLIQRFKPQLMVKQRCKVLKRHH